MSREPSLLSRLWTLRILWCATGLVVVTGVYLTPWVTRQHPVWLLAAVSALLVVVACWLTIGRRARHSEPTFVVRDHGPAPAFVVSSVMLPWLLAGVAAAYVATTIARDARSGDANLTIIDVASWTVVVAVFVISELRRSDGPAFR